MKYLMRVIIGFIILVLMIAILTSPIVQKQYAKRTVITLGESIIEKDFSKAKNLFLPDAIFVYNGEQISYLEALERLESKIRKGTTDATIYVSDLQEMDSKRAIVSTVIWLTVNNKTKDSYGETELKKNGMWGWKISKMTSTEEAFGEIFFKK